MICKSMHEVGQNKTIFGKIIRSPISDFFGRFLSEQSTNGLHRLKYLNFLVTIKSDFWKTHPDQFSNLSIDVIGLDEISRNRSSSWYWPPIFTYESALKNWGMIHRRNWVAYACSNDLGGITGIYFQSFL